MVKDTTQPPGIRFTGIVVDRIQFQDVEAIAHRPEKLEFGFAIHRRVNRDASSADVTVFLRVTPSEPGATFNLEVSLTGRFEPAGETPNMALEEFVKLNGPTLVVPFVRELVANITARSRSGLVLVPPVNVLALVNQEQLQER